MFDTAMAKSFFTNKADFVSVIWSLGKILDHCQMNVYVNNNIIKMLSVGSILTEKKKKKKNQWKLSKKDNQWQTLTNLQVKEKNTQKSWPDLSMSY